MESAKANFMPVPIPQPAIVINSDGTVSPASSPIERNGNIYTLATDITGYTIASERDNVVIDGNGYTLRGNGSSVGVFLKNRNGITVRNLTITGFAYGIELFAEGYFGLNSTGNTLTNNVVTGNKYGIYLGYSFNNVLRNNRVSNSTRNFWIGSSYVNDIDASNTVDGKPIIYWVNVQNRVAPPDAGYVAFVNCTNVTAQGLSLSHNSQGILVASTVNAKVTLNLLTDCDDGIYVYNSAGTSVTENTVSGNKNGIHVDSSSNNLIQSNNAASNEIGVYITGNSVVSANNTIAKNKVTTNSVDGLNLWGSTGTIIAENTITKNNQTGINMFDSQNNTVASNVIVNNTGIGIKLWYDADGNTITSNNITANNVGILVNDSFDNTLNANNIERNTEWGMRFEDNQNNNVILQNNFNGNRPKGDGLQVSITGTGILTPKPGGGNIWDNGTAGNYWSDYRARYPNASEAANLGTGDTPYYINENNADHHPLMAPSNSSSAEETPAPTTNPTPSPAPTPTTNPTATPTPTPATTQPPTPAPSVPELPWWVIALLFAAAFGLVAVFGRGQRP